jgi:hypothetical protein
VILKVYRVDLPILINLNQKISFLAQIAKFNVQYLDGESHQSKNEIDRRRHVLEEKAQVAAWPRIKSSKVNCVDCRRHAARPFTYKV